MKCAECHRDITTAEAKRRAEYRRQPDGSIKVFGRGMPDGEMDKAAGQLVAVNHNGCYWAAVKSAQRARR